MPALVGVVEAIDRAWEKGEKGNRPHLGASQVGKPCERALVYSFRHAVAKRTQGRMLRLFNRGHREEPAIIGGLRKAGMEVQEFAERLVWDDNSNTYLAIPWDAPIPEHFYDCSESQAHIDCALEAGVKLRQWEFKDVGGHHAGSTDGKAKVPEGSVEQFPALPPEEWFGLEFKTYNTKSFQLLWDSMSVQSQKPEHYSQMQEYMHYMGLKRCLYLAVCKNDDRMYDEVIEYDENYTLGIIEKARRAITARQLPPRFSENATNHVCKFCDYRTVCHFGEPLVKSCRTCKNGVALVTGDAGEWHCAHWAANIPKDAVRHGCDLWSPITD